MRRHLRSGRDIHLVAQVREATSAGGVVVRDDDGLEVCLINPTGRRAWGLPKGGVEPGESDAEAAVREVAEETGIRGEVERELGSIDYWFGVRGDRVHKTVRYFLVHALGGSTTAHDDEVREARWLPVREALTLMTYPNEREMVRRAAMALGIDLGTRGGPSATQDVGSS
ncbi:MAG TPA: NUDIX hydrolase [Thermoleophilia bacterium]|nr:NUDIX hydrolase [Thermoleophilia bacterium]HQG03098.1 NUDIX hydrolase [Thermoleophilia bacterium]HQG54398.1 NUDIX hydrolase [Thermoleophilia bacterium]